MAFIKKDTIEKVFEVSNLVEVIQDFVELKKSGATYKGLSPWTDEKSGSLMVSPAKGIWKDFSSGKGGNNAISFVMEKTGCTYPEAIEYLAKKYVIPIEYDDSKQAKAYHEKEEKRQALRPLLEASIRKYEEQFHALPEDHPAKLEVYGKRQYTKEIVEEYRIGYAPGQNFLYNLCKEQGRLKDAQALGLVSEKSDKWVDRVIYPLIERKGTTLQPVGMAGRSLSADKRYAKWMNSADSELYKKDTFWYGLDNARESIVKNGSAWLVEGYNDVIAWQTHGIPNTIASCGTAIAERQIQALKKFCDHIIFCLDQDSAGIKSMLRYIPEFMIAGFRVQVMALTPGLDPDDFVRVFATTIAKEKEGLQSLNKPAYLDDGFKFLMNHSFNGKDAVAIAQEAKKLTKIIAKIEDEAMKDLYLLWLSKESGTTQTQLKKYLKYNEVKEIEVVPTNDDFYILPKSVKEPLEKFRKTIEQYEMFMANNQIWVQGADGPPYNFRSVSNFSIEIIQHMQDEKFPMKLVRVKNIHGLERIFDMQSSEMNSPMTFENAVTAHGNFRWKGGRKEHELLKTYLFDGMGTGRKIEVLGWQAEGFWIWNNTVTVPGQPNLVVDENGVFEKDGVMYYIPSANEIYKNNLYKYEAQKKLIRIESKITFQNYAAQVVKVHRNHGMMGILFSIASMFQDIVVNEIKAFPMLFLFGQSSSGKDLLADCCQSFFGHPQTAINLEGGVSTMKAQVREFAQFANTISQLSEYKPGDPKLDGSLKGFWDRRGYKRGNIDSHVGTDSIPILSSVIMTGNYAPDQEALVTRLIWNFMDKNTFTVEEGQEYEKLNDMNQKGVSGFTELFLAHREMIKNNFKFKYREFRATLSQRHETANARMLTNLSVLGTFFQMFQNIPEFHFPWSHTDMLDHFDKTIELQMNKLSTASTINRWWDCFLASMRGTLADQIKVGRDFKLEGDHLYFNFTSCYLRVSRQWYVQYRDTAPAKGLMMDALKKDKSWIDALAGVRFASGRDSKSTSAYLVNLQEIPISEEIKFAVDFQTHENSLFNPPATPDEKNKINGQEDLPF